MTLRTDVSVIYVDPRGPYPKLVADWWDEQRDARNYAGPNPIVAHPPCGPWSKQRHNYKGSEHDCAPWAVAQVRRFGGVLEHPAESKLWDFGVCNLPPIGAMHDGFGGFSMAVDQVEFGHPARKRTWLYIVGAPRSAVKKPPYPGRAPTHWCSGNRNNKGGGSVPPGIKVCSAQQRRRTPIAFAEWLIELAAASRHCGCPANEFAHELGCRFWPNARSA